MHRLLLLLLALMIGCSSPNGKKSNAFEEKEVGGVSLLISAGSSHEVRAPSEIKAVPGGFLVYDYGIEKVFKLDPDGNKLLAFGKRGQGPGEFQEVFGLWEFDDVYWLYDYSSAKFITYDQEGKWMEDFPIDFEGFPHFPTKVEVVTPRQFVVPSGGKNGSLFMLVDMETQNIRYFGDAVGEYMYTRNSEEARQAISLGRIPADMRNAVILSSNQTGIFSFQQTTAILEKYSYTGALIWQKNLKVPAIEDLFEHLFRENRKRINRGEFLLSFSYVRKMSANKDGVALLLNTIPEEQPVTVAWVPNDGGNGTVVTFPGIENKLLGLTFTVSADGSYIFFVSALDGEVYRAEWPF